MLQHQSPSTPCRQSVCAVLGGLNISVLSLSLFLSLSFGLDGSYVSVGAYYVPTVLGTVLDPEGKVGRQYSPFRWSAGKCLTVNYGSGGRVGRALLCRACQLPWCEPYHHGRL